MLYKWNITIPQLTEDWQRKAYVYVPDWYEEGSAERFPVLYMFEATTYSWTKTPPMAKAGACWNSWRRTACLL